MASVNKVILVGNLGKDPEIRHTAAGQAVASFSLATSEKWKNKQSGEYEEKTEWHNITLWGKTAEIAGEYLTKGKTIYIEGRLQTRKWEDKDGNTRYTTEVVGDKFVMMPSGKRDGEQRQDTGSQNQEIAPAMNDFDDDSDIPF